MTQNQDRKAHILLLIGILIFIGLAFGYASGASAQTLPTCTALGTSTPIPWNEARVQWTAPTTYTDGTAIPAGTVLTFTVYRSTGAIAGTYAAQCTTVALGASMVNQPVGTQWYTVTARVGTNAESTFAVGASKVIAIPTTLAPGRPTGVTVN